MRGAVSHFTEQSWQTVSEFGLRTALGETVVSSQSSPADWAGGKKAIFAQRLEKVKLADFTLADQGPLLRSGSGASRIRLANVPPELRLGVRGFECRRR